MPKKIFMIVNPESGRGLGRELTKECPTILAKNSAMVGWRSVFAEPEGENTAANLARQAQKQGFKRIVVAGGDGTLQQVVQGLCLPDPSISLSIIPVGRVNNLANALGLPRDTDRALDLALNGENILSIDLGAVNEELFVSTFGIGIGARTNETAFRITARLKKMFLWRPLYWTGLWELVFWAAGLSREIGKGVSCERVILKADVRGKVSAALLTVNNVAKYAHRFWLTPGARLDDGLLDLCLIKGPMGRCEALALLFRAMRGTHIALPKVSLHQIQKMIIQSKEPLIAQIDGEPMGPCDYYEISVFPKALNVIVPPSLT